MAGRINAHGNPVRVLRGDALVHVEQVAVPLLNHPAAQPLDGVVEIEIHAVAALAHASLFIAHHLGIARGHVARHQIAKAGIFALQKVIAIGLNDRGRRLSAIFFALGHPNAAIVAQGLRH